jgi:hypothetical protein
MSFNLATILAETVLAAPEAPAHLFGGTATTYGQLDEQSGRLAAGLREAGLNPGDVVALQLPNLPHFVTAYFGALKAGLVVLPLNPLLMAPELEYHLGDSSATVLIGFEGLHAEASKACERLGIPLYLVSMGGGPLPEDTRPVSELFSASTPDQPGGEVVPRAADDTAVLIYTSGTTGKPKGAELTHFQLYMNCTIAGQLFGYRNDDVTLAGRFLLHRRPRQGPGDPGRVQRLPAGDRVGPVRPSLGCGGGRDRQAGRAARRGGRGRGGAAARSGGERGRHHRLHPGAAGGVQVSARDPVHGGAAEGAFGEDPEVCAARRRAIAPCTIAPWTIACGTSWVRS